MVGSTLGKQVLEQSGIQASKVEKNDCQISKSTNRFLIDMENRTILLFTKSK
jgi:hypothetical protein